MTSKAVSLGRDAGPMRKAYRVLSADEQARIDQIKDLGNEFWLACEEAGESRELSLAKTKIEEAVMWAVKGISG